MSAPSQWFGVDKEGLAKILRRKGVAFALYEFVQNSWDTHTTKVTVTLTPVAGKSLATLIVEDDDPDGFADLTHAFTLFAESNKKADPSKRGRFNLGEKLVLALCQEAEIRSTKGMVRFDKEGRSTSNQAASRLERGSIFKGILRIDREELKDMLEAAYLLLPPIPTTFNGELLEERRPIHVFEATLPTEVADEEGYLRRTARKTEIRVYEAFGGKTRVYEMGIPVVETDLPWSIEVMQKIPLNADRDNITPAYARDLGVLVLNEMHPVLRAEEARLPSIQEALADERVDPAAVQKVLTHQFGEKRAIFDPSDPQANNELVSQGYTIIPGGTFSKETWRNIRNAGELSAGKIAPTPKPYGNNPDGLPVRYLPEEEWTEGLRFFAQYAAELAWRLIHVHVEIHYEKGRMTDHWAANYGHGHLTFNHDRLGREWFKSGPRECVNDLLIHEFAHEKVSNHLDADYYKECTRLGAKLCHLALTDPDFFKYNGYR